MLARLARWGRRSTAGIDVRTWLVLTEASALSSLAAIPYVLSLRPREDRTPGARLIALAAVQAHVTFGLAAALGLKAAGPLGLGAPHIERRVHGRPSGFTAGELRRSLLAGAGSGAVVAAADLACFSAAREELARAGVRPPSSGRALLASSYGAVAEEVLLRLFAQSWLARGARRRRRERRVPPSAATMGPAIVATSVLFGAAHLPAVSRLAPLRRSVVVRTIALNAIPGVVLGRLYWKRSLEAAMAAHLGADLFLTVIAPRVARGKPAGSPDRMDRARLRR